MPPRGRKPQSHNVFAFDDSSCPTLGSVLLDTSFVFEALSTNQPRHEASSAFLSQLAADNVKIAFSSILELELAESAYKVAIKERFPNKRRVAMRRDGRALRRATRLCDDLLGNWSQILDFFEWRCVELDSVKPDYLAYMKLGIQSYDAAHLATASGLKLDAVITLDTGFGLAPKVTSCVLTHSSLVRGTRGHRS